MIIGGIGGEGGGIRRHETEREGVNVEFGAQIGEPEVFAGVVGGEIWDLFHVLSLVEGCG
jgi:hypothetical protein